jgi:3-methyladenine DNA glycosylase/8-oxoguanine DNA glycosylase
VNGTRDLAQVDTLNLAVSQPFNFRYTFWKPSHFATGLETHSHRRSWRAFRLDGLSCGIRAYSADERTVSVDVFADGPWEPAHRDHMARRLRWAYGLDEDLTLFVEQCRRVPAMAEPLAVLAGMRQSCPENLFEIAVISLLLQNATVTRTTQMMRNLLSHYGHTVRFAGVKLQTFFTPGEIADVPEDRFRLDDRLGYRAKYLGRFAAFFVEHGAELEDAAGGDLTAKFQQIKGVGPYTAAIIGSHASRDPAAFGLDVWNRKLLARRLLGVDDAKPDEVMGAAATLFPGHQGLAALYLIEHEYARQPVVPLIEETTVG